MKQSIGHAHQSEICLNTLWIFFTTLKTNHTYWMSKWPGVMAIRSPPAWPERINNSDGNYPRELLSFMAVQKQAYPNYNELIECFLMTCVHIFVKRWHFRFDKQTFFHDKDFLLYGGVAQLVEHHNGIVGVWGSTPHGSTIQNRNQPVWPGFVSHCWHVVQWAMSCSCLAGLGKVVSCLQSVSKGFCSTFFHPTFKAPTATVTARNSSGFLIVLTCSWTRRLLSVRSPQKDGGVLWMLWRLETLPGGKLGCPWTSVYGRVL